MSIDFTPIARRILHKRVRAAASWTTSEGLQRTQLEQLAMLTAQGAKTAYGAETGITKSMPYADYRATVPVVGYEVLRPYAMRMVQGERSVLWPGVCRRFAQSSGTSDGRSKFIPVTDESLHLNHYRGAGDAVAHYLHNYPDSHMFAGKGFILGGSFATELQVPRGVKAGDLSAHLIEAISPVVDHFRVPRRSTALMADWRQKVSALVAESLHANITNISGVPSWFMTVLRSVIAEAGAETIHDVWPRLEVFFHGGISMAPYREPYAALTDPTRMRYVETYNASEGFFAVQDLREPGAMLVVADAGVFFEFVPLDEVGLAHPPHAVPAWQVEHGKTYALVITAPNGLWRYAIGDTVRIESTEPLRISIAGRTKHYINAFGEEVMVHNTDAALANACAITGARVADYTVAPVFAADRRRGRHQWLIEWVDAPADIEAFALALDEALQRENSDYAAKRAGTIFLDPLTITTLPRGTFDRWLAHTGKLGGQRKVPRLTNDRHIADAVLALTDDALQS